MAPRQAGVDPRQASCRWRATAILALLTGLVSAACAMQATTPSGGRGGQGGRDVVSHDPGVNAPAAMADRIVLINMPLSRRLEKLARSLGGQRAYLIYGDHIHSTATGGVDVQKMLRYIDKNIPRDARGFGVLDIEDPYFKHLGEGPGSRNFAQAQHQMLRALRAAKAARPNVKWTFYGLPLLPYWMTVPGERWKQTWAEAPDAVKRKAFMKSAEPQQLFAELDWFAPSIYDFYPDARAATTEGRDRAYVKAKVGGTKVIAGDRPVLPYVKRRYHHNGKPEKAPAFGLTTPEEFQKHLTSAIEAGADGVVWWGADDFYVRLTDHAPPRDHDKNARTRTRWIELLAEEMPPGMSKQQYLEYRHEDTLRLMFEVVQGKPYRR